ncbi:DUF2512 family protein [Alkalibacterium sp.]|nr:MAG: DUF2512 family protein [Alkalibacterium sp.]
MKGHNVFGAKVLSYVLIGWVILRLIFNVPLLHAIALGLVLSLITYILADIPFLKTHWNKLLTALNFLLVLAGISYYLLSTDSNLLIVKALVYTISLTLFDYFHHIWLQKNHYTSKKACS